LLRAAAELIVERGIERTSLTAIGERAGLSHTLVNHLFGSKGALVERLNDLAVEYYMDRATGLRENRTGLEALTASARLYLELVTAADPIGRVHVVMWAEAVTHARDIRESQAAWDLFFRTAIARLITDGIADGSVRADVSPEQAAVVVVGTLRGVALQSVLNPATTDTEAARDSVVEFVTATLFPR
jgi:AcrR family transcriptional regulator